MEQIQVFILMAILVEGTVQWFKTEYRNLFTYVALAIGIMVAFAAGLNMFDLLSVTAKVPAAGYVLTGILFARGANVVNDLIGKVRK